MEENDVKKILEYNEETMKGLNTYLEKYIKWVVKNIPSRHMSDFKVGIAVECPRLNEWSWGIKVDEYDKEEDEIKTVCKTVNFTGYAWEQHDCFVKSLSSSQKKKFAKNLPSLFEKLLRDLQSESEEINNIKKIDFDSIKIV